jgi:hypothetical protein
MCKDDSDGPVFADSGEHLFIAEAFCQGPDPFTGEAVLVFVGGVKGHRISPMKN